MIVYNIDFIIQNYFCSFIVASLTYRVNLVGGKWLVPPPSDRETERETFSLRTMPFLRLCVPRVGDTLTEAEYGSWLR